MWNSVLALANFGIVAEWHTGTGQKISVQTICIRNDSIIKFGSPFWAETKIPQVPLKSSLDRHF